MKSSNLQVGVLVGAGLLGVAMPRAEAAPSWMVRESSLGPAGKVLAVSPDRSRVARIVKGSGPPKILVDSAETLVEGTVGLAWFSHDGKRFAYWTTRGGKVRLFVDGVEQWEGKGPGFVGGMHTQLWFSRTGSRWFLGIGRLGFAILKSQRPDWYMLFVDGEHVADEVVEVFSDADGLRFGYLTKTPGDASTEGGTLVLRGPDGVRSGPSGVGPDCRCAFSADGKRLAYGIRRGDKWRLVVDGVESGEYDDLGYPGFSADGQRLAFPAKRSGKWSVVLHGPPDQEIGGGGDAVGFFCFSEDGQLVYTAKRENSWITVLDGVDGERYEEVGQPVINGKRLAYRARRAGRWWVVVDGQHGKAYEELGPLVMSSDGSRLVHTARSSGKWVVVTDGREGLPYEEIARPALSPDGRHIVYAAKRAGKWRLVVDGIEGDSYEFLTNRTFVFDGPREFHTLIQRGGEYLRLQVEISP